MNADLHAHSNCSDGSLSPRALLKRAAERGVELFSITDHDTLAAYASLEQESSGPQLVVGIELSSRWFNSGVHVVGLNVDRGNGHMAEGIKEQARARLDRAAAIAERLRKRGVDGSLEGALALADGDFVGRPHFAEFLVQRGVVDSQANAFKKYLGDGKAGDVRQHWPELSQVIDWIRSAGGVAVLAHPLKYRLTRSKLKRLIGGFVAAGGEGLEVVSGQQSPQHTDQMGRICRELGLLASCGSDFHRPGLPWSELGSAVALPHGVTPVWSRF